MSVFLPVWKAMWTHTVADVQIQMTMYIMGHELLIARCLPWNPSKTKISGVKGEKDPLDS